MTGLEIALVVGITAVGALVHGCVGIGIGLVAGPVLVAIDPTFVPGPLLLAGQLVGLRHVRVERRHIVLPALRNGLIGLPFGLAGGLVVLVMVDERLLSLIIGVAVATAAGWLLTGPRLRRSPAIEILAGGMVAFSSTTAALPGPPLVVAYSDMAPRAMRGTASAVMLAISIVVTASLIAAGRFGTDELALLGWLLPGVALGLLGARWLRPVLDRKWFRTFVLVVAATGGVALILRQLV